MSFVAFDPRLDIIDKITTEYDVDGDGINESVVSITYPDGPEKGNKCRVPIFMPDEARTGEMPNMPFIEFNLMSSPGSTHNVQGNVRYEESYMDLNIYVVNNDEIKDVHTWLPVLKNELVNLITTYRSSVSYCDWMEVSDSGREIIDTSAGRQVVFHHVISIYANYCQGGDYVC